MTNRKMEKNQRHDISRKEIRHPRKSMSTGNRVAEDFPSYATVKNWVVEFKWESDNAEEYSPLGHLKISTTDKQVGAIHRMVWRNGTFRGSPFGVTDSA